MKKNLLIMLVLAFLLASCSLVDNGPSDQETQVLFEQFFFKQIPIKWAGSYMGGKLKSINITNLSRGKSIKSQNGGRLPDQYATSSKDCWPVSMHVKGLSMAYLPLSSREHEFEEDAHFMLCQSYENNSWSISSEGIMMSSR